MMAIQIAVGRASILIDPVSGKERLKNGNRKIAKSLTHTRTRFHDL
jgi:hypothetical protein